MKIGILGCGYVGQAAAKMWSLAGHELSATTRKPERLADLQTLIPHPYLLTDASSLFSFLSQLDTLLVSVAPDSFADYQTTYLQTARQIAAGIPHAPHLKQILYTSSTSVYGDYQGEWVDETARIHPSNANNQCLYETEQILLGLATEQRSVCIFRLGEIYGPQRDITDRLRRMHARPFPGTGNQYTNLIHVDDITRALDFAIQLRLNGIFNLCNDFHIPRKVFYEALCQKAHLPPIQWNHQDSNPHGGNKKVSNQKLKSLGFSFLEPLYSLHSII
ncbi:SDR family oxidoreductase [Candidatus Protochlamydia phocaeensis]|uniref:SDR family oxidoreductase n=1 Tax=Candidatus Protochlamydia phocaeensis TaxID=1414722 RepID=UPI0008397B85|nr:SDR family oxidoreductase [Candidatus Protochlamydia phocaeensis]